ncbi:hypothetical protein GCM10010508_37970 [Streptomyces naganishii JCM 4654]|uniref:Uncharacterized protein n=1 Tax=Streptomyces naganishii JCM 4654 TaxID=1306179 RepID=A0A919CWJ2_9ACTN|nr:hypothetical protein GCM10010508_37970 [Streptomyces naganishii JCM 4654]
MSIPAAAEGSVGVLGTGDGGTAVKRDFGGSPGAGDPAQFRLAEHTLVTLGSMPAPAIMRLASRRILDNTFYRAWWESRPELHPNLD